MEPVTQRAWTWIVEHREWVFSGIGTALVVALLTYFLSQETDSNGVQAGGDINVKSGKNGAAVIQTGDGDITINKETPK